MKRIKMFLITIIFMIPIFVSAEDLSSLPYTFENSDGTMFYNYTEKYSGIVENYYEEITIDPSKITSDYYFDGPVNILLNDKVTIYNIKGYFSQNKETYTIIPIEIIKKDEKEQSIILKDLKVVGYKLDYKDNINDYTVEVPSNIDKVYVIGTPIGNTTTVTGGGIVELKDKTTKIELEVANNDIGTSTYRITIVKKNKTLTFVLIVSLIFIIIIVVIIILFKKYLDKASSINPEILKRKIKEVNAEDIIKSAKEKENNKMNDISGENITPGVLTPRTMIPDNDNK